MTAISQDAFFSKLFETGMSDPNSKVYIPKILMETTDPSLNPYKMSSLDLGKQSIMGVELNVELTDLAISGIPNITTSTTLGGHFTLTDLDVDFLAQFCKLNPPPKGVDTKLVFASKFTISFPGNSLKGSLTVDFNESALGGKLTISGNQLEDIVLTINSLEASVPQTITVNPVIKFDESGGAFWAKAFEGFLKKISTINMIVSQINDALNTTNEKKQLSTELSAILQKAIKEQLT